MTTTEKFSKAEIDLADAIEEQVSPALAKWVYGQFGMGRSIADVKSSLYHAVAVVENERT